MIRFDLVDKDVNLTPTIPLLKRGVIPFLSWLWPFGTGEVNTFDNVKTLGTIAEFDYMPRNNDDPVRLNFFSSTAGPC